jgi:hypothetical protein
VRDRAPGSAETDDPADGASCLDGEDDVYRREAVDDAVVSDERGLSPALHMVPRDTSAGYVVACADLEDACQSDDWCGGVPVDLGAVAELAE